MITRFSKIGSFIDSILIRLNADGSPDEDFGNNGKVSTDIYDGIDRGMAIALQADDQFVITGTTFTTSDERKIFVARYLNEILSTKQFEESFVSIYPNPAREILNVQGNLKGEVKVEIFDMLGKKVMDVQTLSKVDVSSLAEHMW